MPLEAEGYALMTVDRGVDMEQIRADMEAHINRLSRTATAAPIPVAVVSQEPQTPEEDQSEQYNEVIGFMLNSVK